MKKKDEITIRSSVAEYLTYVASVGDNELTENATIRNFRIVQNEGNRKVSREVKHYSLQMIIAVGFKVNNERAVQFRKWSNSVIKDYTIQGWVMDEECLNGFLKLMDREILNDAGKVSAELAKSHAKANLKNIELYKIVYMKVILTDSWHLKKSQRENKKIAL